MMIDVKSWLVPFKILSKASKINPTAPGKSNQSVSHFIVSFSFASEHVIEVDPVRLANPARSIAIVPAVPVIAANTAAVKITTANTIAIIVAAENCFFAPKHKPNNTPANW